MSNYKCTGNQFCIWWLILENTQIFYAIITQGCWIFVFLMLRQFHGNHSIINLEARNEVDTFLGLIPNSIIYAMETYSLHNNNKLRTRLSWLDLKALHLLSIRILHSCTVYDFSLNCETEHYPKMPVTNYSLATNVV